MKSKKSKKNCVCIFRQALSYKKLRKRSETSPLDLDRTVAKRPIYMYYFQWSNNITKNNRLRDNFLFVLVHIQVYKNKSLSLSQYSLRS